MQQRAVEQEVDEYPVTGRPSVRSSCIVTVTSHSRRIKMSLYSKLNEGLSGTSQNRNSSAVVRQRVALVVTTWERNRMESRQVHFGVGGLGQSGSQQRRHRCSRPLNNETNPGGRAGV